LNQGEIEADEEDPPNELGNKRLDAISLEGQVDPHPCDIYDRKEVKKPVGPGRYVRLPRLRPGYEILDDLVQLPRRRRRLRRKVWRKYDETKGRCRGEFAEMAHQFDGIGP
jgi:hypothetical protein